MQSWSANPRFAALPYEVRRRAFAGFFVSPAVERAYGEAKGETLTPDPTVN